MTNTAHTHIRITPAAMEALDAAKKAGYTKGGFASQAIVEKAERELKEKEKGDGKQI